MSVRRAATLLACLAAPLAAAQTARTAALFGFSETATARERAVE